MKESQNALLGINELIPGVILIKELKEVEDIQNNEIIGAFLYKIKLERMNILNLEIDFSNSKNILLNSDYYRIKNFNNIKLLIFNFDKKIAIENTDPNNYRSQIEVYLNESKRISDLEPMINPSDNLQPFLGSNKKIKFNYDKSNININNANNNFNFNLIRK